MSVKFSLISLAVASALTFSAHAAAVQNVTWNTATVPASSEMHVEFTDQDLSKNLHYLEVLNGASGTLNNLDLSFKATGNASHQLMGIAVYGGNVDFGGESLNINVETNFTGGGDNQLTGFYLQPVWISGQGPDENIPQPNVILSAKTININAKSTHTNGKSVYGLTSYTGLVKIVDSDVTINVESNTERSVDKQYSEVVGIGMATFSSNKPIFGRLEVSEDSSITIHAKSNSAKATFSDSESDRNGGAPVYGVKIDAGQATIKGALNITAEAVGANAAGIRVSNQFYNSSLGDTRGDASIALSNTQIQASSKTGKAFGLDVDYRKQNEDEAHTVLLESNGTMDVQAYTESGTARAISVLGTGEAVFNGNLTASASAKSSSATTHSLYIDKGSVAINGAQNSLAGDVSVGGSTASLSFGKGSSTTIDGNVTADSSASISLTSAEINLAKGRTAVINGTLASDKGVMVLNEVSEKPIVTVAKLKGDISFEASGAVNDTFGSAEEAAKAMRRSVEVQSTSDGSAYSLSARSGTISESWTSDAEGKIVARTKNESLNALEHFSASTLVAWRGENNHLTQRLGDIRDNPGNIGAWARIYGYDSESSDAVTVKYKSNAIQVGTDFRFADNYVAGLAFNYADGEGDFSNGSADSDSYTIAAYISGFFPCGGFFDVIGRVGRSSTDMEAANQSNLMKGSYDNTLLGLSAEVGSRLNLSETFYAEPQAELSYGRALGDDFMTSNGLKISQDDYESLVGRLGARFGANFPENKGSVYLHASVNHDFLGDSEFTATLGKVKHHQEIDAGGTWVSYGIGAQFNATSNLNFYGSLERSSGSDYEEDYRYNIGLRLSF